MSETTIPLVDLEIQHARIKSRLAKEIEQVMSSGSFILGPQVTKFEESYARFCGVPYCVGVGNGTDAIELILRAFHIGRGDEVVVPANTFVATAEAVSRAGAKVVLADCARDYLIDPIRVAEAVGPRTRAIIPVHLYGQMAPIEQITDSVGPNILIIEDAAQSQGAERGGSRSGAVGVAAATSFYPGKNLGAYGDAGAVTTRDEELAHRIRMLRNHGGTTKYEHELVGCNSRLDELQAVVLSTKLKVLDDWNAERRKAASRYAELLANVEEVEMPQTADRSVHVWHLYVVRVPRRDEILAALNSRGIAVGIHYPAPLHKLPAFADLDRGRGWYPNSELYAEEILSLPVYPGITAEQQWRVAEELQKALCG